MKPAYTWVITVLRLMAYTEMGLGFNPSLMITVSIRIIPIMGCEVFTLILHLYLVLCCNCNVFVLLWNALNVH